MSTSLTGLSPRKLLYTKLCDRMNFIQILLWSQENFASKPLF